jgi:amidase
MRTDEYTGLDAVALAGLVAGGEVTAEQVAQAALDAIGQVEPGLGAVVETYPDAPRQAAGAADGPLRGVPFLVKDVGPEFAGLVCENGSRLGAGQVGEEDSAYATLVRRSGVTLVGRTATPEFSMSLVTSTRLHGETHNPWRRGYSTNGSSGGAAAAVAAGLVPLAHSSDIGGSTRGPAAWCGVVGLHPSRGRVSAGPWEAEFGHGMAQSSAVCRTVRDAAAFLDCVGILQPGDPYVPWRPDGPWAGWVGRDPGPLRIAWSAADLHPTVPVDAEVAAAVERVARVLDGLGHRVEPDAPAIDLAHLDRLARVVWFSGFDTWLDDVAASTGRTVGPDTVERQSLNGYHYARGLTGGDLLAALAELNAWRRNVFGPFFGRYDVWLTPTTALPSQPNADYGMDVDIPFEQWLEFEEPPSQYLLMYNAAGQPAISLPLAQHSQGLPIGLQLGARHGEEHLLLAVAAQLEDALPWRDRRPPVHAVSDRQGGLLPPPGRTGAGR